MCYSPIVQLPNDGDILLLRTSPWDTLTQLIKFSTSVDRRGTFSHWHANAFKRGSSYSSVSKGTFGRRGSSNGFFSHRLRLNCDVAHHGKKVRSGGRGGNLALRFGRGEEIFEICCANQV